MPTIPNLCLELESCDRMVSAFESLVNGGAVKPTEPVKVEGQPPNHIASSTITSLVLPLLPFLVACDIISHIQSKAHSASFGTLSMPPTFISDNNNQSNSIMETTKPASPTLQGIPPELRTEIYTYLAISERRDVSGRQFVKLNRESQSSSSGDLWKQFQSAIAPHPLTLTCRQMHTEFNHALATTPGQTYNLVVNNLDLEQLTLFHRFVAAHCSTHRISGAKIQPLPLLFEEVRLSLHLDGNVLKSIESYLEGLKIAHPSLPFECGEGFDALAEIRTLPKDSSRGNGSGGLTINKPESEPLTEKQAKSAKFGMHLLCHFHAITGLDRKVVELMLAYFKGMVNSRWPTIIGKT